MGDRVASPLLVGREAELGTLARAVAAAAGGSPQVVLVAGEAGLGKSRLVAEATARAAARGARVAIGGCVALGGDALPYAPFTHALAGLAADLGDEAFEDLLGPARPEIARLLPELRRSDDDLARGTGDRALLFRSVLRALEAVASGAPLVLVVEDLHWADLSSLELLDFVTGRVRGRILLIGTYRSDELHRRHPLRPYLAQAARSPQTRRVDLVPLTPAQVGEQVAAILGTTPAPGVVDAVVGRAEGNPFFAEELLAAGAGDELPPGLGEVLHARLAALPDAAQQLVAIASVAGPRVGHELLTETAAARGVDAVAGLQEATGRHVLVAEPDGTYAFRHALLQEAAYAELLPAERTALHRTYAAALEGRPAWAARRGGAPAELARHLLAAGEHRRALAPSVAAAVAAAEASAVAEAHALYEQAVALWDEVGDPAAVGAAVLDLTALLERAADAAALAGEGARAVALVRRAIGAVDVDADPGRAAVLYERLGRLLWAGADGEEALAAIETAVRLVPEAPTVGRCRVLAGAARTSMLAGRYAEARVRAEEGLVVARACSARREEGDVLNTLGVALGRSGDAERGVALLEQALTIAEAVGSADDVRRAYNNLAVMLDDAAGRPARAVDVDLAGAERLEQLGYEQGAAHLRSGAAMILLDVGEWGRAQALAEQVLASAAAPITLWRARLVCGLVAVRRGAWRVAHEHLARALELIARAADADNHSLTGAALAELALAEGLADVARGVVDERLAALGSSDAPNAVRVLVAAGLRAAAEVGTAARRGQDDVGTRRERGRALLERARLASAATAATPLGAALDAVCAAEYGRLAGDHDPAAWAAAAATRSAIPHPYEAAYARWREAEAHLALGDRAGAAVALDEARRLAAGLGAEPLLREVDALARRGRLRPTPPTMPVTGPGAGGLTPREQEVLELVAAGHTNRQVARALFMSEKTASVHVSRILAKLGVSNRSQAAAVAHRQGLVAAGT